MKTPRTLRAVPPSALFAAAASFGGAAFAEGPTCGEARDESWMPIEAVRERVETLGYTIEDMGDSEGNCYEVAGLNVQGRSVTTYLDPRTGDIVQEDIVQ